MFDWLKKERCKACHEERAVRYCLRRNKNIGWQCCNGYRADGKCPTECPYTPKSQAQGSPLPEVKTDSRAEFIDYLKKYLPLWVRTSRTELDDKSPLELSADSTGKERLAEWLRTFSYPDAEILNLLNQALTLDLTIPPADTHNPEQIVAAWLQTVVAHDWDAAMAFFSLDQLSDDEVKESLLADLAAHPVLRKTTRFQIINAGFTEDRKQAFVFCELNGKENWTAVLISGQTGWRLYQNVRGTLQDYYAQKELFRKLALALNEGKTDTGAELIAEAFSRYPLCPDAYYYKGLMESRQGRLGKAKQAFEQAHALEPQWNEPLFNLALINMQNKDFDTAVKLWQTLANQSPDDENIQNNLGVCYLGLNLPEQAEQVWNQALLTHPNSELLRKNLEHLKHE